jgi:DNA-binding transcriptional LysR family regulator
VTSDVRELALLVEVVRHGSFSAAARAVGITPSAVSKAITRLEGRLGVRVLERTTHQLRLTAEGELLHGRALHIVEAVRDAEAAVAALREVPRGLLTVSASAPVVQRVLVPALATFRARYPEVELDLKVDDAVVNLLEAKADVALRVGPLPDSSLRARRLFTNLRAVVAAPAYLDARGRPAHPHALAGHDCLLFDVGTDRLNRWPFREVGPIAVTGPIRATSGEAIRALALAGLGLARLGRFLVAGDLASGRLEEVLAPWAPDDAEPVHAVFLGEGPVPARVRVFVDHMAAWAPAGSRSGPT